MAGEIGPIEPTLSHIEDIKSNKHIIKQAPKIMLVRENSERTYRGSKYIGVSSNGEKWQIFFIFKHKKYYKGLIDTEINAAKV